jgi:Ni,Fe-hydrogenase I small subunit
MSKHCQRCGTELEERKLCAALWLGFYACQGCGQAYLEVADPRWIYPLQFLEIATLEKALHASDEQLAQAAAKIEFINYKTVSIVEFEKALTQRS